MASQTGSIDFTASNSVKLMAEAGFENVEENYYTKAELDVTVQGINTEVSKKVNGTEIISTINQSAESVSISASKINLTGAVTISDLANDAQNATLNSNISVGGRNLSVVAEYEEGYLQTNTQSLGAMNATRQEHTSAYIPVIAGETYVFQNWVTPTTGGSEYLWMAYQLYDSSKALVSGRPSKTAGTNTGLPQHETYVVAIPTGVAFIRISARLYSDGKMKLEKGNKATDWSQAQEDLEAYADESAYLSAKPNIAPLGSVEFSDVYNATTNPNGYWRSTAPNWFTQLDDGWIRVYVDNSAGTGAVNTTSFRPSPSPTVVAGNVYTILTEIRNNVSTGTSGSNVDFYLQQINNNQFWGNRNDVVIDDDHVTTTTMVSLLTCGQSYALRSYRIADTDHLTAGTPSPEMFRYNFRAAQGSVLNFDFRMSVYEGIYDGPYKPYSGTQLFATQTDASNAAKTATSYVTEITGQNGIMVHPSTDDDTGVQITSDVDILRNEYRVINVGTQGDTSGNTDAGVTIYDGTMNENVVARFDGDGIGLVGDAFLLSSAKVADSPEDGVTSTTSKMHMGDKNSDYSVQSYLDTYIELGHLDGVDQDVANGNFHVGFDIEDGEGQLMHNAQLYIGAGVAPTGVYTSDASLSASDVSLMATETVHISGKHISIIDTESSPSLYCDVSEFISGIMCHSNSSAEEVTIGSDTYAASNRALRIDAIVQNSSSTVNGHAVTFLITTNSLALYDSVSQANLWHFGATSEQASLTRGAATSSWSEGIVTRYNKVVTMTINSAKLASALASGGTSGSITTIPTGYRPSNLQRGTACISTTGNYANVWFVVSNTGNVAIANRSSLQIPTTAEISMQITYIID